MLAKKHRLTQVISSVICENGIELDSDILAKLQRSELKSAHKLEQMKYTFSQICEKFDTAGISYIPLKGDILRSHYPSEYMRTSCDIDILVHECDLADAICALEALNYQCGKRNYHDVLLKSPENIYLELHFNINENLKNLDSVLKDAWDYALPIKKSRYEFTKEFFVFQIFAHMSYHFLSGGCGIRSLMDIWVMKNKMGYSYQCAEDLLKKAGIYQFAAEMDGLAEICFSTGTRDEFSDTLLKYIFDGGVYGTKKNNVAIKKTKSKNTATYILKRFFLPYKSMITIYPALKKLPFLLPLCWILRGFKMIFSGKTKKAISEVTLANSITDEKLEEVGYILLRLGL